MRVRRLSAMLLRVAPLVVLASSLVWSPAPWVDASGPTPPFIPARADWLTTLNYYRSMSGLLPVSEDPALSAGALSHSRYMIGNGTIVHDEVNGAPFWTKDGDEAGNNGNVAVSSNASTTARKHVELWMTGPFHAIGVLRPKLILGPAETIWCRSEKPCCGWCRDWQRRLSSSSRRHRSRSKASG